MSAHGDRCEEELLMGTLLLKVVILYRWAKKL